MTLEALERVLEAGREPDDVLRDAVSALVGEPGIVWVGIAFLEQGDLVRGPSQAHPKRRDATASRSRIGGAGRRALGDGAVDRERLQRVAARFSPHAFIGWDTGGERRER